MTHDLTEWRQKVKYFSPQLHMALNIDLASFESQVNSFGNSISQQLQSLVNDHTTEMSSLHNTHENLASEREHLQALVEEMKVKLADETKSIEHLEDQIIHTSSSNSVIKPQIVELEQKLERANVNVEAKEHFLLEQRKKTDQYLCRLNQGPTIFRQHLGLWFENFSGKLKVNFSYLDPLSPSRTFYFVISLNNDLYSLCESVPRLPKEIQDKLVSELNESNQLAAFAIKMRQEFVNILKSKV
ncbi:hypothetical protein GEMRC1_001500 [Eukaryota sp. GEM-RC1]